MLLTSFPFQSCVRCRECGFQRSEDSTFLLHFPIVPGYRGAECTLNLANLRVLGLRHILSYSHEKEKMLTDVLDAKDAPMLLKQ